VLLDNFQFIREIAHFSDGFPYFVVELIWIVLEDMMGACPVWVRLRYFLYNRTAPAVQ
jgi:hypothetical protein